MLTALRALPLLWRLGALLAVLLTASGLVYGAYAYVRHQGYVDGYSVADAKCAKEKAAQEAANRRVMEQATKALDALNQKLELKELQVDDILKGIDLAADQAPDAASCGLDLDGVRRLSTIQ